MESRIEGFEDYLITSDGKVYSLTSKRYLKPILRKDGYYQVGLHKDNKKHMKLVHRLVADAFIDNAENKPLVNHIDANKLNNHITNLEWVTYAENSHHAWNMGLHENTRKSARINLSNAGKKHWRTNLDKAIKRWVETSSKPIKQIDKNGNVVCVYTSQNEARRVTGINNIGKVVIGQLKTSGGYKWEYCGEEQNK